MQSSAVSAPVSHLWDYILAFHLLCLQESPANAKGTRDSSACMKAHCEQM